MIVHISRIVLIVTGALGGMTVSNVFAREQIEVGFPQYAVIIIFIILGSLIGYVLGGIFGRELSIAYGRVERRLHEMAATDLMLGSAGLILGLLTGLLIGYPLRIVAPRWLSFVAQSALLAMLAYIGTRIALLKRVDVARAFPRVNALEEQPVGEPAPLPKFLDTSAVIDGRFVDLARAGFLEGPIRVPRFVLAELQTLADSPDDGRRARGRRGLDLLATLQGSDDGIGVFEMDYQGLSGVDDKLIRLAEETGGAIVTVDYNLSQVARVRGIRVLSVHELAEAVRPNYLPGELMRLSIVKIGKEADQGVGYLEDGTMVVVQGGREHVGANVEAEVTSVLQTSAGRMIFTRLRTA